MKNFDLEKLKLGQILSLQPKFDYLFTLKLRTCDLKSQISTFWQILILKNQNLYNFLYLKTENLRSEKKISKFWQF